MILSFFQALNPASKNSGVCYPSYVVNEELFGTEIMDSTVSEKIKHIEPSIRDVFDLLVGTHYSGGYMGICSKGILDYLIFPLVSRKILHAIDDDETNIFFTILAYSIALPLEVTRFSLGIALTLMSAPIICLINLFQDNDPQESNNSQASTGPK